MPRIHRCKILWIKKYTARWQLFDDAAEQGCGERDVVPASDKGVYLAWFDAPVTQHGQHLMDALLGIRRTVPDRGVAFLLIVANQAHTRVARHLHQCNAAIVASWTDANQINRVAATQLIGKCGATLPRKVAIRRLEAVTGGVRGKQPAADPLGKRTEPGVCRSVVAETYRH